MLNGCIEIYNINYLTGNKKKIKIKKIKIN